MTYTAGIDVGSTYTKAVVLSDSHEIVGRAMLPTGFKLTEAAEYDRELWLSAESSVWVTSEERASSSPDSGSAKS